MPGHPSISRVPRRSSAFRWGVAAVAFVAAIANPALADTTLFGPRKYKQTGTGTPPPVLVTTDTFGAAAPSGVYIVRAVKSGAASGTIRLNGQAILEPADFAGTPSPTSGTLLRPVTLIAGANELVVELGGAFNTSITVTVLQDTTPPTITAKGTPVANASGWNKANVTVKFTCSDSASGIESCPAPVIVTDEGAGQVISGTATDKSGNTASASVTLSVDKTNPVVTATAAPAANVRGWNNGPVTVTFAATDALSGVAPGSVTAPVTLATDGVSLSATGQATDVAGRVGTGRKTGLKIDQTPPSIVAALSPPPNANGWNRGPVAVHFTCSDSGSGILSCPPDQSITTEGANQPLTATARDRADNAASPSATVSLDTTPPVLTITSPADGAVLSAATVTIGGTLADGGSGAETVSSGGQTAVVVAGGAFSLGPLPLVAGPNVFVVVGTDRAGNTRSETITVIKGCSNRVPDPGFESGVSGFEAQDASSQVIQSDVSPLDGAHSLGVAINGYGNNVWWTHPFAGGTASHFAVSAHLRSDLDSSSILQFCAMVYYADGTTELSCAPVSGAAGDKGVVTAELTLDAAKPLSTVNIRLVQEGSDGVRFTLDDAVACLDVITEPTGGGGGGDGGGGDDGGGGGSCPTPSPAPSVYPGYTYTLPTVRPFISLSDYTGVDHASTAYLRFKAAADDAVGGNPPYNYSATHSVLMFDLSGQEQYIDDAIARVEQQVQDAETAIALGEAPAIAGDSYLEVGFDIEQLALAYDHGYARLTDAQRQRWASYAEQALFNVWNPSLASWGGVPHEWSGWSINDPGNNYHFSFLRATMLWALATQEPAWLQFLQSQKFGPLASYYAQLAGGGSREGTGYGTAQKNLFENYLYWRASTGEDLAALSTHTRDTIDYWLHATVPTRDRFAPIGDQSRSSIPELFDYHENLVHAAVVLAAGTPQAARGTWWLQHNSVDGVSQAFNLMGDLLPYPDAPAAPTDLAYHASAAGHFFARSGWDTEASWLAFVAGPYDQSHAHHDQGSFTFFKGDWLAVSSNIWSHSGLQNLVSAHNVVRFERGGEAIEQNESACVQSSMTYTNSAGVVSVHADLTNAYSGHASDILSWTRDLEFSGDVLRVHDACTLASGVQPVFQLHVPVLPVVQPDGSLQAGGLHVIPLQPVTVNVVTLSGEDVVTTSYRIELTAATGCAFDVELRAQP